MRVAREALEYARGDQIVSISDYGRWERGATVEFVVNGRWNPPRTGPALAEKDAADIEEKLRAYAAKNGVVPRISFDWS